MALADFAGDSDDSAWRAETLSCKRHSEHLMRATGTASRSGTRF